jgi:hypothetical protein
MCLNLRRGGRVENKRFHGMTSKEKMKGKKRKERREERGEQAA